MVKLSMRERLPLKIVSSLSWKGTSQERSTFSGNAVEDFTASKVRSHSIFRFMVLSHTLPLQASIYSSLKLLVRSLLLCDNDRPLIMLTHILVHCR